MRTLIFPGFSPGNRQWAYDTRDLIDLGHEVVVVEWRHWTTGASSFAIKHESEKATTLAGGDTVNIIAKSVGTRLAARLIKEMPERINKVILCGVPTNGKSKIARKNYSSLAFFDADRIIVFQNENDPFANFDEVKKFIQSINSNIKVVRKPKSDHDYPYAEDFQKFLLESKS